MQHAMHTIAFFHLLSNGKNEGVYAFVCQIRDEMDTSVLVFGLLIVVIKNGSNGVDNGRI